MVLLEAMYGAVQGIALRQTAKIQKKEYFDSIIVFKDISIRSLKCCNWQGDIMNSASIYAHLMSIYFCKPLIIASIPEACLVSKIGG